MLSVLIDTFQSITLTHAFLIALFFSLILWAVLWSIEAAYYKRSCEYADHILSFCKAAFDSASIAVYFETKTGRCYASPLFGKILNVKSREKLRSTILETIKEKMHPASWWEFLNHLEFQAQTFMVPFEIEGQTYCLNARAINQNVLIWISVLKAPETDLTVAKRIIDNIPIALWYRNRAGAISYCNQVYAGALEQPIDSVLTQNLELIPSQRIGSPMQITHRAFEQGKPYTDRSHGVIAGTRRFLEIGVIPFRSGDSIGYAFDLQEVEQLQKDIQRNLESHHQIMQQLSAPICVYGSDTRLAFYNNAYVQLFQFNEDWLLTKPTLADVLEDLRTRRRLPELPNFQNYKRERMQLFQTLLNPRQDMLHMPDGQILRMCVSPHAQGGLFYIFEDVSEKIALERRYNTLIAVQKETIDNLYEGIIVFGSDHKLRIMNKAFIRILKINDRDWFMGKTLNEVMEGADPVFAMDMKSLQSEITSLFVHRKPHEDNLMMEDKRVLRYAYLPLPDGSHLLSIVDITDTARFQEALKERNRILEDVDEMKSRFIRHVSYELKSPLALIQAKAEKLTKDEGPDKESLGEIAHTSSQLLISMNDMLDLASLEAGQLTLLPVEISITKFMKGVVNLVSRRAQDQGVNVVIQNEFNDTSFQGDDKRLKQAFFNILFSTIRSKMQQATLFDKTITFRAYKQTVHNVSHIVFSLQNTGFTIKKSDKKKLTKLTNSPNAGDFKSLFGSEFGMTLVKRIIELHGGWISFEAFEVKGDEMLTLDFYCHLPLEMQETTHSLEAHNIMRQSA